MKYLVCILAFALAACSGGQRNIANDDERFDEESSERVWSNYSPGTTELLRAATFTGDSWRVTASIPFDINRSYEAEQASGCGSISSDSGAAVSADRVTMANGKCSYNFEVSSRLLTITTRPGRSCECAGVTELRPH